MPRSRGSEASQRQSPRGPTQLRTSSSDSDPLHHRPPVTDRSPKLGDHRRSPRIAPPDPINQKKLGTRIADLESQLGQAQQELKFLKDQLASAEAAKKEAQEKLENKARKPGIGPVEAREEHSGTIGLEKMEENERETDVFEVPEEPRVETNQNKKGIDQKELNPEPEKPTPVEEIALKNDEIILLKAKLEEKENELRSFIEENQGLKNRLNESASEIFSAKSKEEEMTSKITQLGKELKTSENNVVELNGKLEIAERAKEGLESEMKKLRVQTEQWRKAADAAAAVLAGDVEMAAGKRIPERCGSMDKHYGSVSDQPVGGYAGFFGSPGFGDDFDDGFGGGKRKGSGIRMFGDLWKKKGQK